MASVVKIVLKHFPLLAILLAFSGQASAVDMVWGESNWGEADWSAVKKSVPPPSDPVPVSTKIRSLSGSTTDAGFSAGAYSDSGEPAYGKNFTAGDYITMLAEVRPDTGDVGKNGEIFVIMLSLIGGKQVWSFLNEDGNYESWNLKLGSLGPAKIVQPLDTLHTVTLFEGNLQAGAHRVAVGYMASGGPLIYTAKAISIVVSE